MAFELWLAFVAASSIVLVIPGPTILTVISYSTANVTQQLWIVAFTFVVLATINAALYAIFASAARRLQSAQTARRRFNLLGGSVPSAAGIWALFARQPV